MDVGPWLDRAYKRILDGFDVDLPDGRRVLPEGPVVMCETCGGTGKVDPADGCDDCRGLGRKRAWKIYDIDDAPIRVRIRCRQLNMRKRALISPWRRR